MLLKRLFKYILIVGLALISLYYLLINLGFYFDVTKIEKDYKLIVCLGGGKGERINKTIKIYKKYSKQNPLILLTEKDKGKMNKKLRLLKENNIPLINIVYSKNTNNTYSELSFMVDLMTKKNIQSVNIISDEPHSRRIKILMNNFFINKLPDIKYNIVGSDVKWWNKKDFYKNQKHAIPFVTMESIKIIHNFIYYNYVKLFNIDISRNKNHDEIKQFFFKYIYKTFAYILDLS